jgi:hypothetical protein
MIFGVKMKLGLKVKYCLVLCVVVLIIGGIYFTKKSQLRQTQRLIRQIESVRNFVIAQHYEPEFIKLEKFQALDDLDPQLYAAGIKEMKQHKVVIAGIARDNSHDLAIMIRHVEHLGSFFADYRVIIFENDSIDGTKQILSTWEKRNNKVSILMKDFNNKKRPDIQFLADARNYYLNEFQNNKEYQDFDILIAVDLDMSYGFDVRGIEHSFSKFSQWGAVCSNGISNSKGQMYDMFAFRSSEFPGSLNNTVNYSATVKKGQKQVFKPGDDLVPVYSCFGGLAIYKREFMTGCEYKSIQGDCEHVAFHQCLLNNQATMFLNPAQVIKYSHYVEKK